MKEYLRLKNNHLLFFLLAVLALTGAVLLLFVTRHGIGIYSDSVLYISVARHLSSGRGLTALSANGDLIPFTYIPPFFPCLLTLTGFFGFDPYPAARLLNVFLFGANIFLVGILLNKYSRGNIGISVFGSFMMLTSDSMFMIHSIALSEPLFIFLGMGGLFLLADYLENQKAVLLVASAVFIALAFLTRYVGIALVATGMAGVFFLSKKARSARTGETMLFGSIAILPMAVWVSRNLFLVGNTTGRTVKFHPPSLHRLKIALDTFSAWLFSENVSSGTRGILLLLVVICWSILSVLLWQRGGKEKKDNFNSLEPSKIPWLLGIFIFMYAGVLLAAFSFLDAATPLDNRILSPFYVAGLVLVLCLVHRQLSVLLPGKRFLWAALAVIGILFASLQLSKGVTWIIRHQGDAQGFAGRGWRQSEIIEKVNALPAKTLIFTNGADAVYFLTGKPAITIPSKVDHVNKVVNREYSSQLAALKEQMRNQSAVLVYFNKIDWRWYLPSEKELQEQLSLHLLAQGADGSIYTAKLK